MSGRHPAQINIARFVRDKGDPANAGICQIGPTADAITCKQVFLPLVGRFA